MSNDYQDKIEVYKNNAVAKLRKWRQEAAAKEVMRDFLSEEGIFTKEDTKLSELLVARHKLALTAQDETVQLKAIDSSIAMAAGNEKITNVQNNQFNSFGNYLKNLNDD